MTIQIIQPPVIDTYISDKVISSPPCKYHRKKLLVGKKSKTCYRTLIQFDLSSLPSFLTFTKVTLHIFLSCNHAPYIEKNLGVFQILSKWTPQKVHCTNHPLFTCAPLDVITITNQNHIFTSFNITTLVENWYTNQSANLGLMLKMLDEYTDNLLELRSSTFKDSAFWPYIEIQIQDPAPPDACCKPMDLRWHVVAHDHEHYTAPINILLFNYSYLIVNNGLYPALVHLQVSCDSIHWQTESAVKTINSGEMVSCVPATITKYARLCYRAQHTGENTELTLHIQGRTY